MIVTDESNRRTTTPSTSTTSHSGSHFAAEFGYHFPVHAHAARGHEVFTSTTARSTRSREKLLQAHGNNGLTVRTKLVGSGSLIG